MFVRLLQLHSARLYFKCKRFKKVEIVSSDKLTLEALHKEFRKFTWIKVMITEMNNKVMPKHNIIKLIFFSFTCISVRSNMAMKYVGGWNVLNTMI